LIEKETLKFYTILSQLGLKEILREAEAMSKNCATVLVFIVFVMGGCATLPTDFQRLESHAFSETGDTGRD
jgi:microsomal dipeptidase-like Zn-dependent dipeptidase